MAHTTLSIDKDTYEKTAKRAKTQQLSVSAIARMLLNAYATGRINIAAVHADEAIALHELKEEEITPKMRKKADGAYKMNKNKLMNIPA
jgi:predicted CopG family antitoxin